MKSETNLEKQRPLVSIAMCTCNGERFLSQQLDTLVNQTYLNLEIVIVDDCSTDSTVQILRSYAEKYKNISFYSNEKRLGISKNFEKAISLTTGEYIAISDQDDIWLPDKIESMLQHIDDNMLIYGRSEMIDADGNFLNKNSTGDFKIPYSGSDPRVITIVNFVWGHNVLFNRKLLDFAFPLPEGVDCDWFLGLVALNYGKVSFVDKTIVWHRRHGNNATKINKAQWRRTLTSLRMWLGCILMLKYLKNKQFFSKMYRLSEKAEKGSSIYKFYLFLFIMWHMDIFYINSAKSYFSKMNRIRKIIRKD
ncbi:glycosyltransferase family 2 protein [Bacteroidales bacterium OttesenSCG-928-I21]|nr:glycosyltransferase family 2 protein [Bacteroidales bacterium OttesenSCG-928-I21]